LPGHPIMPGVLIIEGMAQTGGILLLNGEESMENRYVYFMAIKNAKFRRPVFPGDTLIYEVEMVERRSKYCTMYGRAYVDSKLVAEAEMMAAIVTKPEFTSNEQTIEKDS